MGMETYFFYITIPNTTFDEIKKILIERGHTIDNYIYKKNLFSKIISEYKFIIDNEIFLFLEPSIENKLSLSFEICYANFDNVLKNIYLILFDFSNKYHDLKIHVKENVFEDEFTYDNFKLWIKSLFGKNLRTFEYKYGKIKTSILPGEFYSNVENIIKIEKKKNNNKEEGQ